MLGAILAIGKPAPASALRLMSLSDEPPFTKYRQVSNLAAWSAHRAARVLVQLLLQHLAPDKEQPRVFGIDKTVERRWGVPMTARGIYRDALRSSKRRFVKWSGPRRIGPMWLKRDRVDAAGLGLGLI